MNNDVKEVLKINNSLVISCMKYLNKDCYYEIDILNWLKDNFASEEDIDKYYKILPHILFEIEENPNKEVIYKYIYNNLIVKCVEAIENGNYKYAYDKYKNSILSFDDILKISTIKQPVVRIIKIGTKVKR